jgi:hypothetical protein
LAEIDAFAMDVEPAAAAETDSLVDGDAASGHSGGVF